MSWIHVLAPRHLWVITPRSGKWLIFEPSRRDWRRVKRLVKAGRLGPEAKISGDFGVICVYVSDYDTEELFRVCEELCKITGFKTNAATRAGLYGKQSWLYIWDGSEYHRD